MFDPSVSAVFPSDSCQRPEDLEDEITRIAGHINAMDYYFINLLSEFDAAEGWVGCGITSFAHWLNWKCGIGSLVAREKVRVARALRELPLIDVAFRTGELSYSKVRCMTRVATPDNEATLLDLARHSTAAQMEKLVRQYRRCKQLNEDKLLGELDRGFCYQQEDDGMYVFRGRLPADEGEQVVTALNLLREQLFHEQRRDRQQDSASDTTVTENTGLQAKNVSAETNSQPELYTATSASALVRLAEHFLATGIHDADGAATLTGSDKCQLLVHVNLNEASQDYQIEGGPAFQFGDGGFLHPSVVRKLACDASLRVLGEDDDGNLKSIGRKSRIIPNRMTMALKHRDGGCRFPGCCQRRWTDAHHIHHWADGGETSLDNLVTLCRNHHTRLHRGDFQIKKAGAEIRFVNKWGKEIERVPINPRCDTDDMMEVIKEVETSHRKQGITITPTTPVTRWNGDPIDYGLCVELLVQQDIGRGH